MAKNVRTYLLFEGAAEEAMRFYVGLLPGSEVTDVQRYEEGELSGELKLGAFTLGGREFLCVNSPTPHEFGFTPAISIFVDCDSQAEQDRLFEALSEGGEIFMPLGDYGFSTRFGWVADRFGVSWQLNLT